jgi:multisubunit Na+/H+ antiporter MnhG subunit
MVEGTAHALEVASKWLVLGSFLAILGGLASFLALGPCRALSVYSILSAPTLALLAGCLLLVRAAAVRSANSLLFFLEVAAIGVVEFALCYFMALRQCSPV